jgi:hypothetical protein
MLAHEVSARPGITIIRGVHGVLISPPPAAKRPFSKTSMGRANARA